MVVARGPGAPRQGPFVGTANLPPAGTASFLLTGVERSALLSELAPDAAAAALERHFELIEAAVAAHGGARAGGSGEGVLAVFGSATEAVAAALAIQLAFAAERWPDGLAIRVRIGIHTGELRGHDGRDAIGEAMHRCGRLCEVAHGEQTLLSRATASLVAGALPEGAWLADLGMRRPRDLSRPERVFELGHRELAHELPPPRSLDVLPNNLPVQLTTFVGRDEQLLQVRRLLDTRRQVTLAGAGGCGKTRLAVQAAAEQLERWADGVWWLDLGPVSDPALVARMTASTLRVLVEPVGNPLPALTSQLSSRQLLLCLDTCEHLLDACAELAGALLRACPGVSVLATSREPLGLAGETVWQVPPLAAEEAVLLFSDRAALVRPEFTTQAHDEAVRTICRRLDGIPLAIELAAAWVRVLSPAQIAAGVDDRFRLLASGQRGVVARHRTLAASMDWSYQLLEEPDREVLRRLAVFSGGFTLEAARAVCVGDAAGDSEVLPVLGRLIDKSLVVVLEADGEARYRLLDTIRQYAEDRLHASDEAAAARDRHLDHFLGLAEKAELELDHDQDRWRAVLETEHDNLRAALQWGLDAGEPDRGRRLAASLARLWFLHGHVQEGLGFLQRALELAPEDTSGPQASLLSGAAMLAWEGGRPTLAAEMAARGLEIAAARDDNRNRGRCLAFSAFLPFFTDFAAAQELSVQAQHYAQLAGDRFGADFGLLLEACTLTNRDRHQEAVVLARRAFERAMPRGERFCAAFARAVEVWAALFTGDLRLAEALASESARIAEPLGDYLTVGQTTANLAWVKGLLGEIDAGRQLMEPIVRSVEDAGLDLELLPWLSLLPGKLHLWGGDYEGAVAWLQRAARFAEPVSDNWVTARALPSLASALRRLGRLDEAWEQADRAVRLARSLNVPHALAEALEESAFLVGAGDPLRAEELHHQALAIRVERGLRTFWVDSLEALASLAAGAERFEEAARLLAASTAARDPLGYPRPAINQPDIDATLAVLRAALGDEAFAAARTQGEALSLDEAVAYASRSRGARDRPSRGWASLTPTELEVVRLVVEGLTNPEIGARLFMSRATVKTHLSHVYAKLGITNRTELATFASTRISTPSGPST